MKQYPVDSSANSTPSRAPSPFPQPQEIERRARSIWEEQGRPEGRAVEHWLAAESELRDGFLKETVSSKNGYNDGRASASDDSVPPPPEKRGVIVAGRAEAPEGRKAGAKPDVSAPLVAAKRGKRGAGRRA